MAWAVDRRLECIPVLFTMKNGLRKQWNLWLTMTYIENNHFIVNPVFEICRKGTLKQVESKLL